jgi:hypothetical protein
MPYSKFLRDKQHSAKAKGHKIPAEIAQWLKAKAIRDAKIRAIEDFIYFTRHDLPPFVAVGEYEWHEARGKK